jgi:glyceraldehyde 3-phosphate dehydrogenase
MKNIAINGFGRIGRLLLRRMVPQIEKIVAINDLTDAATLAHLLKYDTAHRMLEANVEHDEKNIIVNGHKIPIFAEREAKNLPWKSLGVEVVADCSGFYKTIEKASQHLDAGAKKVVIPRLLLMT